MTGHVILDEVLHTPFERLHWLKGEFNSLFDLINERGGDATPLKNKVERLTQQADDLKDLQESYSDRITFVVQESRRIEVGIKLDKASNWLNAKGTHYNVMKAKLDQVESHREELLKELQSLYDEKKDLSCQMVAWEDLLQVAEQEVFDLQGQINTLNATEVIASPPKLAWKRLKLM